MTSDKLTCDKGHPLEYMGTACRWCAEVEAARADLLVSLEDVQVFLDGLGVPRGDTNMSDNLITERIRDAVEAARAEERERIINIFHEFIRSGVIGDALVELIRSRSAKP
jgi:hypothetical protein